MPTFETPNNPQGEKMTPEASSIDAHAGEAESDRIPVRLKISKFPSYDIPRSQPNVRLIVKGLQSFTDASESEIEDAVFKSGEGTFSLRSDNSKDPEHYAKTLEELGCTVEILPAS